MRPGGCLLRVGSCHGDVLWGHQEQVKLGGQVASVVGRV